MRKLDMLKEKYEQYCQGQSIGGKKVKGVKMYGPHDLNGPVKCFIILKGGQRVRVNSTFPRRKDLQWAYPPTKEDFENLFDKRKI